MLLVLIIETIHSRYRYTNTNSTSVFTLPPWKHLLVHESMTEHTGGRFPQSNPKSGSLIRLRWRGAWGHVHDQVKGGTAMSSKRGELAPDVVGPPLGASRTQPLAEVTAVAGAGPTTTTLGSHAVRHVSVCEEPFSVSTAALSPHSGPHSISSHSNRGRMALGVLFWRFVLDRETIEIGCGAVDCWVHLPARAPRRPSTSCKLERTSNFGATWISCHRPSKPLCADWTSSYDVWVVCSHHREEEEWFVFLISFVMFEFVTVWSLSEWVCVPSDWIWAPLSGLWGFFSSLIACPNLETFLLKLRSN